MTDVELDVVIINSEGYGTRCGYCWADMELHVLFSDGYQTQGSISDGYRSRCELLSDEGRTRCGD